MTARPVAPWSLPRALLATLSLLAALALGALLALLLTDGAPPAALAGWSAGAALVLLALRARFRRSAAALPLQPGGTPVALALLTGVAAALFLDTLALAPGGSGLPTPELAALVIRPATPVAWPLAALYLLLLQPLAEGLVFRGLLQPALQARASRRAALLLTALAWALFHLLAYTGAPGSADPATLYLSRLALGLLLGILRARNVSARASIVAHTGINLFFLLRLLSQSL
ncbi:MAG: CPBP family intramembrane metalloprotease [Anaerolineae bacterium]|nr:CPBP family intramembrane metalloprotease [Anaerolineae bacterium]